MHEAQKTVTDYSHQTCIMKATIDNTMNVANGIKVLLIDTLIISTCLRDAFHDEKFRKRRAGVKSIAAGCRADEYTFDRLESIDSNYNNFLIKWNFSKMWHALYSITIEKKKINYNEVRSNSRKKAPICDE